MAVEFSGKKVAALGGDRRQYWFVEEALKAGLAVNGIGLPPEVDKLIGKPQANSVGDALEGVDAVLFPIPRLSSRRDGSLYSDYEPFPLFVGEDELSRAKNGAALVLGHATDELRSNANKLGMNLLEYSDDDVLAIQNSIPTAEGAISYTIKNTDECFPTLKVHDNWFRSNRGNTCPRFAAPWRGSVGRGKAERGARPHSSDGIASGPDRGIFRFHRENGCYLPNRARAHAS